MLNLILVFLSMVHEYAYFYEYIWGIVKTTYHRQESLWRRAALLRHNQQCLQWHQLNVPHYAKSVFFDLFHGLSFGTRHQLTLLCSWEGKRSSGVTMAVSQTFRGIYHQC